ncbi:MAG: hypothetical protein ABI972_07750 [Acidobacteriota bacterium]
MGYPGRTHQNGESQFDVLPIRPSTTASGCALTVVRRLAHLNPNRRVP